MFKLLKDSRQFNGALDKTLVSVSSPEAIACVCACVRAGERKCESVNVRAFHLSYSLISLLPRETFQYL